MGIFKQKVRGYIEYYKLQDWWAKFLTDEERQAIQKKLPKKDTGISLLSIDSLLKTNIFSSSASKVQFVASLIEAGFEYPEMRNSIEKIVGDIESWDIDKSDIIDLHFLYFNLAKRMYKKRKDYRYALDDTIKYCEKSISIAKKVKNEMLIKYPKSPLPSHFCYKQLIIILEKQEEYQAALNLCIDVKAQGWAGDDWIKRIEKLEKKLEKNKK